MRTQTDRRTEHFNRRSAAMGRPRNRHWPPRNANTVNTVKYCTDGKSDSTAGLHAAALNTGVLSVVFTQYEHAPHNCSYKPCFSPVNVTITSTVLSVALAFFTQQFICENIFNLRHSMILRW